MISSRLGHEFARCSISTSQHASVAKSDLMLRFQDKRTCQTGYAGGDRSQGARPRCIGCFLGSFAALAAAQQQPVRALRLGAATDAAFQMVGIPLPLATGVLAERGHTQAMLAVDAATHAAARAEGNAMTLEQAVAYALEEGPPEISRLDSPA